ncbi:transmembrane amino acid transporter protein [Hirsutella rhossiliensis]|uniref:Transmembrane amino acid transporter protein n=1 Tax=Hirsutella rhossiliensis TaxID=111463 RepID=A0A9P8N6N6_9HYPO|nr:transmembrane amino acid transporter protein [Hirsutella rhossiliensis]KAH0967810.1 transmembrane amino acid transporter protein [Hirsutella rhossiliensis]
MASDSSDLSKTSSQPRQHQQTSSASSADNVMGIAGEVSEFEERRSDLEKQKTADGSARFNRLGWKRLTIVLIVEAVALGSLSLPQAFATLGMVAGVICTIGLGLIAIYTSDIVGQVKLKYPEVEHYADAGRLLMGRFGYEVVGAMFVMQLTFLVGSHTLTGTIAFLNMTNNGACSVVFGFVSAVILLILAVPPSFAEVAILGYIDFASILIAIGLTIIATGIQAARQEGGMAAADWSAWPKADISFADAFIAIANIVFAYSFCMCQFSFMDEMHTPRHYIKSIWSLGIIEIAIYTLTGALVYAFVGADVQSPALLSAGPVISKIAFGIALPVIFISGSINTTVVGRYLHGRMFKDSVTRFINTPRGWITWLALITVITIIAFIIAEVIPFFSDLLSISSSLFISGFTFYLPAMMWFKLLREGSWHSRENIVRSLINAFCFLLGIIVLVCGTYASIVDIMHQFKNGSVRGVFTCAPIA